MTIRKFKNKGLKKFFENGDKSGILPAHTLKIELILDRLDAAVVLKDMQFSRLQFSSA